MGQFLDEKEFTDNRQEFDSYSWDDESIDDSAAIEPEVETDTQQTEVEADVKSNKKVKKSKKAKDTKEIADNTANEVVEKPKMVLYMLLDKPIPGLLGYLRAFGLNVTAIFTNVDTARGYLLMQTMPTRVVVVDSGSGKFITTTIRKELIDMVGVNGEDSKFTVFYSDPSLKSDAVAEIGKEAKEIEWIKYKSTAVIAAIILSHNEEYIIDEMTKMEDDGAESNILSYTGEKCLNDLTDNIGSPIITPEQIMSNIASSEAKALPAFEVVL